MPNLSPDHLLKMRDDLWSQTGAGRIRTPEEALPFFDRVGFCLFLPKTGIDLPNFKHALDTGSQDDAWYWKDSLPATRQVYYGANFRGKPGFISLRLLPALYALAPVSQLGGDLPGMIRWAGLSRDAASLTETLTREGPLSTKALRAATGLDGKKNATAFNKALEEVQRHYLVTKIGVTSTTRANYGYIWNTFQRVFPVAVADADQLDEREAAERVLMQYIQTAVAIQIEQVIEVLALDARTAQSAAERLIEQVKAGQVSIEGKAYLTCLKTAG